MTILFETRCYRADVNQEIGFHDNQAGYQHPFVHTCIKHIQLHPFTEDGFQVAQVDTVIHFSVAYGQDIRTIFMVNGDSHITLIPFSDDTPQTTDVGRQCPLSNCHRMTGQQHAQGRRDIFAHHRRHQQCQGACIIFPFFFRQRLHTVRMAPHTLYLNDFIGFDLMLPAQIVHLRKQVAIALIGSSRTLMTNQHQRFVHHLVHDCRLQILVCQHLQDASKQIFCDMV